ncbi:hypothetical protein HDU76_012423 [Blyttiomyces sp. JEL0837]|nr:hypothetical protein HDU76_012423 [Blyttiomyces sp. JEL0837]
MGQTNLAKDLQQQLLCHYQNDIDTVLTFALNVTTKFGNRNGVAYLLSLPSVDLAAVGDIPLKHALFNSHTDILKMLLDGYRDRSTRDQKFQDIFAKGCLDGNITAVKTLLSLSQYFPTTGSSSSNWRSSVMLGATSRVDVVRVLLESGKGFNTGEVCSDSFVLAACFGLLDIVRLFAVVEGVDLDGARIFATQHRQMEIVEFLAGFP